MAFDFSLQTALIGTFFSAAILSATLFYLWRNAPAQQAERYWALAFATQALRITAQFGVSIGHDWLWFAVDLLFVLFTLFIWLGGRTLESRQTRLPLIAGLLVAALLWETLAGEIGLPFHLRTLPLYLVAGIILLLTSRTLFRLARRQPGIGYRGLAAIVGLLGLHYLDYPFLRNVPWFAPIGFGLAAILMLTMGIAMLIITQRRQQAELRQAMTRLGEELTARRESESRHQALVDELEEGVLVLAREGAVLSANPAAARMLGVPLEQLRTDGLGPRPYRLFRENGEPLEATDYPLPQVLSTGRASPSAIYRLEREDGSSLWISANAHPLFPAGGNVPYAAMVAFSDVSDRKAAERNLVDSELRFRSVFEGVADIAVQGYDRVGRLIYWNAASTRFYGYTKDEALGQPIEQLLIPPFDRPAFRQELAGTLASGTAPPPAEKQARTRDGSSLPVYSTQVLINNLQGEPEIYRIDIDTSTLKQLEHDLDDASERFRALSESSELGMVVTDENGNFVWCNPRYLSMIDSTMEEVLDGTWIMHLHRDERQPMRRNWRRAVASKTGFVTERRVINRDGSCQWGQVHVVPIRSREGIFRGFVATVEDITARKEAEEALRRSEAKFRATFDQAFQLIGLLDRNGILLDANRTALNLIRQPAEAVVGRHFADTPWWSDPGERERLNDAIRRAAAGESVHFEAVNIDADGRKHYVDFSLKPVIGPDGEIEMLIPEGHDITSLKQSQEALRISEARFAGAFHASLDYITISHLDTGLIIDVNEAFETITGWTRDEAIGRTSTDLGVWIEPGSRDEAMRQLARDGYLREYSMRLGTRSGTRIEALLNASIINAGDRQLLLGVVRDISKQKAAEESLRRSEEKFSRIVHYSPVALAITDVESGVLVDVNRAWQEFLGYTREQVIGRSSIEFGLWVDNADRENLYRRVAEANGELDRHEVRYRRADGQTVFGLISCRIFDVGGRACYLWAVTDITLRHRMEERMAALNTELEERVQLRTAELQRAQGELIRAEKLAALGSLVAGIAHELNTPIGNSVTVASTLHDKTQEFATQVADGTLRRSALNTYLESARTASDLLLRSLYQARSLVASFKQVAVDQTSDQRRRFDLAEVVGEVLTTLSPTLRKTPFAIDIDIPPGILMDSYPGPLGQVINNFVNNALLHAFDGRYNGTIRIRAEATADEQVTIIVADDGNGIPEEHHRRIFDPFFTTKLGQGGSGLGLNIVYNIVTRVLGGHIDVESHIGAGTTFVLKMPLHAPDAANDKTPLR